MKTKHIQKVQVGRSYDKQISDITTQFKTIPKSGATICYPGQYPITLKEQNIKLRNYTNILGTVITNPDGNHLRLGISSNENEEAKEDVTVNLAFRAFLPAGKENP